MRQTEFDDPAFLERLRRGEDAAYRRLIHRYHASLTSVAASIIGSRAQAEEVVQDAWLAVFSGIDRFEGRSSLTTWVFSIVLNRARTRIGRERRTVALPPILDGATPGERAVPQSAFKPDGHWIEQPVLWDELSPERVIGGRQLWDHVLAVIEVLPAGQRAVVTLRDIEGQDAETTCALLGITAENQRVLLHRARGRIRQRVDDLLRMGTADSQRIAQGRPARSTRGGTGLASLLAPLLAAAAAALGHALAAGLGVPIHLCASSISSTR